MDYVPCQGRTWTWPGRCGEGGGVWCASSWWDHGKEVGFPTVILLVQEGRNAVELLTVPLARVPVFKA